MTTQTKVQHTPGPWEYGMTDQFSQQVDIWESKTTRTLARTVLNLPIEEQWANALLIAAAPELLAALECVMEQVADTGTVNAHEGQRALAAIQKARGQ